MLLALVLFVTLSAGGLALTTQILIRLPVTYFSDAPSDEVSSNGRPIRRSAMLLLRNIAGVAIILLGIILTLPGVPGPGILTILLGIMLMDFPGKRRLERWLIRRPKVLEAVNRLRQRHGKAPFVVEQRQ